MYQFINLPSNMVWKYCWIKSHFISRMTGWPLSVNETERMPVRISVRAAPRKKTVQQLDIQADLLRKIMVITEKHHVTVNLHNHTYEVVDDLHDLKGTLARIPDANLGPDLNWLVRGGVDPVWFIRRYGEKIVFLHLRDQYKDGRWSEALGEGDMDYAAIGKVLRDVKFNGIAVIELAHENKFELTRPLRESWKISRQYVRQVLG